MLTQITAALKSTAHKLRRVGRLLRHGIVLGWVDTRVWAFTVDRFLGYRCWHYEAIVGPFHLELEWPAN